MATATTRPIWSGSIGFGLVSIPVQVYTAVREHRIAFRTLHDQDLTPLKQKMYCQADGTEVHREHMVKGYEISKDNFVVVTQEDLEAAAPKKTRAMEIQDFVDLSSIDPRFFDQPYFIAPTKEGARPYRLLLEAMQKSGKVGIAKVVMHSKEYLTAIRPLDGILCMETMHFADEVVEVSSVPGVDTKTKADPREIKIAEQLIEALLSEFDPAQYHDDYRDSLMTIIRKKAAGQKIVVDDSQTEFPPAINLMDQLRASLSQTKPAVKPTTRTSRRPRVRQ